MRKGTLTYRDAVYCCLRYACVSFAGATRASPFHESGLNQAGGIEKGTFCIFTQKIKLLLFQIMIGNISSLWSSGSKTSWVTQGNGLQAVVAWMLHSLQRLAAQWKIKFIWNCLMHYLCNNQGSEFILQIIIAFVALMAKISQSSEPLTGFAFSGKHQHWVYNAKPIVRDLALR